MRDRSAVLLGACQLLLAGVCLAQPIVADHHSADQFEQIPAFYFETIRDGLDFFYGRTSHGYQIISGMEILAESDAVLYEPIQMHEHGGDLGTDGDLSWVNVTREFLDQNPDCDIVIWSWCGGLSDNTYQGVELYLSAMTELEGDYPNVTFVYMTGHLDGSGPGGNLYARNNQIREYCIEHDKVLFDFADIESYDPDGTWYPDETDACNWCYSWCGSNECPSPGYCAHSHSFNCYRKARAFWWMMAKVSGWSSAVDAPPIKSGLTLYPAIPNPFNPRTIIKYRLEDEAYVELEIHDSRGHLVKSLRSGVYGAGVHEVAWNGRDSQGRTVPGGCYVVSLISKSGRRSEKLTLLK